MRSDRLFQILPPLTLTALLLVSVSPAARAAAMPEPLTRIAFGSCADQEKPQPIWAAIAAADPQLFLFLGDNIYADHMGREEIRAAYARLAAVPEFQKLRSEVPILAIWDDHDYGVNDGSSDHAEKELFKELFLEFFAEPADSPRRTRGGLYTAETFGPPGRRVQVILLDVRYFRSPIVKDPSPYRVYQPDLDLDKTLLGEEQWRWFEEQLRQPAEVRLIGSGIQVLGYASGFESWKNLPHEQERLFRVLRETAAEGVIFLSGDAHFAQLKRTDAGLGYPLYEFTSSGLTHSRPEAAERPAPMVVLPPYGGLNFATIDLDWQRDDPLITLELRDRDGVVVFRHRIPLSELQIWEETFD